MRYADQGRTGHGRAYRGNRPQSVILTPKAAERLGIETVAVREVEVTRKRMPGGEVVRSPAEKVADVAPPGSASRSMKVTCKRWTGANPRWSWPATTWMPL